MTRDLDTFSISEIARRKLRDSGFITSDDLKDIGPIDLSKESGLTREEAVEVLEVIFSENSTDEEKQSQPFSVNALEVFLKEISKAPIPTFCQQLDRILGGGIVRRKITEICGSPGTGKTQLCMQLCVNAQIPLSCGGSDGEAIYIDTEGSVSVERLSQIADHTVALSQKIIKCTNPGVSIKSFVTDKVLEGIHYFHCTSYLELVSVVNVLEDYLVLHPKVCLIVVDSIAFHFRYGFQESNVLRTKLLNIISQTLVKIANDHELAVVVTNQMAVRFQESEESSIVPALGESWGHSCTIRLILLWDEKCRRAQLFKSPWKQEDSAEYQITASGVRDCSAKVSKVPYESMSSAKRPRLST